MKKMKLIVEWNSLEWKEAINWVAGLHWRLLVGYRPAAHLRHAIPFQRKLTFLFHSSRSALFPSFAVTQEKRPAPAKEKNNKKKVKKC